MGEHAHAASAEPLGETVAFKVAGEGCSEGDCVETYVESRAIRTDRRLQRIMGGPDR